MNKLGLRKNFLKGTIMTAYYVVVSVLIPYYTLRYFTTIQVEGVEITYGKAGFEDSVKWILRLGMLVSALAFFRTTAPKGSKRSAWAGLLQTLTNVAYIYSFRYGGVTEVRLLFADGYGIVDMGVLLTMIMGQVLLLTILNVWDVIHNTWFWSEEEEKEKERKKKKKKKKKKKGEWYPEEVLAAGSTADESGGVDGTDGEVVA
ncbi:MAG: hypothetical protein Kow0069_12700 [Promethearchaeota archaeon]